MPERLTQQNFIDRCKIVHNNKYDYSKVVYKNISTKVIITCPIHGDFMQIPGCHLDGKGCSKCSKKYKPTNEEFINAAKKVHGEKYDYSKTVYKSNKSNVVITCKKHGDFKQIAREHLRGSECPLCQREMRSKRLTLTLEQFIKKSKAVHGDTYDYSLVDYKSCRTPVKIICKKHGIFNQVPVDHYHSKAGCPKCAKESHGERIIRKWLETKDIVFIAQKKFEGLRDKKDLSYDFYLPNQKIVIEFNGEQHYEVNKFFHDGIKSLEKQQYHDLLKENYAKDNNLRMISIPYTDINNICSILQKFTYKTNFTKLRLFSNESGNLSFQIECKYERKEKQERNIKLAKALMNKLLQDKNIKAQEV